MNCSPSDTSIPGFSSRHSDINIALPYAEPPHPDEAGSEPIIQVHVEVLPSDAEESAMSKPNQQPPVWPTQAAAHLPTIVQTLVRYGGRRAAFIVALCFVVNPLVSAGQIVAIILAIGIVILAIAELIKVIKQR